LPVKTFTTAWDELLVEIFGMGIPVKPFAKELLEGLAAAEIPVAVATSTRTSRALEHLEDVQLLPLIQAVVGGEQVTHPKPAPEIYHKAASMLGMKSEWCVAFEDSDTGTTAAVRSGARTVQVPDLKQPSDATIALEHMRVCCGEADAILTSLCDGGMMHIFIGHFDGRRFRDQSHRCGKAAGIHITDF